MNDPTIIRNIPGAQPNGATFLCLCLDESGSMATVQDETIQAFNTYVENVRKDDGTTLGSAVPFTAVKFNTVLTNLHDCVPLKDVPLLTKDTYKPDGFTALYDAVAHSIRKMRSQMKDGDRALLITLTDGHENSSRETTHADLVKLIAECKDAGNWTFVFLGANPDTWDVAQTLGIPPGNTVVYNTANVGGIMAAVSSGSACYAQQKAASTGTFTDYQDADWAKAGGVTIKAK